MAAANHEFISIEMPMTKRRTGRASGTSDFLISHYYLFSSSRMRMRSMRTWIRQIRLRLPHDNFLALDIAPVRSRRPSEAGVRRPIREVRVTVQIPPSRMPKIRLRLPHQNLLALHIPRRSRPVNLLLTDPHLGLLLLSPWASSAVHLRRAKPITAAPRLPRHGTLSPSAPLVVSDDDFFSLDISWTAGQRAVKLIDSLTISDD